MPLVFISYRRRDPDSELALELAEYFKNNDFDVFIDTDIEPGQNWEDEIEQHLAACDVFAVLLSPHSVASDMVRGELSRAYKRWRAGELHLIPIHIHEKVQLPYQIDSQLQRLQYTIWRQNEGAGELFDPAALAAPPEKPQAEDAAPEPPAPEVASKVPLPEADPRLTGVVPLDSEFYIRREADDRLDRLLDDQHAHMVIIRGARQSGKSSLLTRARARSKQAGSPNCYLDFQMIDDDRFESLDRLLRYLAAKLAREFGTALKPGDVWDDDLGAKESLTLFLEDAILPADGQPQLTVCLDEADKVFHYPYRKSFFAMLRAWHEKTRRGEPGWVSTNIVFTYSTDPSRWIDNPNQSPFNVATKLDLPDFSEEAVGQLAELHPNPPEARRLVDLLGGQPFLTRTALYLIAHEGWSWRRLDHEGASLDGPFAPHLRYLQSIVESRESLKQALRQCLAGRCDSEADFQILCAAGIIKGDSRAEVSTRCELYQRYFERHL